MSPASAVRVRRTPARAAGGRAVSTGANARPANRHAKYATMSVSDESMSTAAVASARSAPSDARDLGGPERRNVPGWSSRVIASASARDASRSARNDTRARHDDASTPVVPTAIPRDAASSSSGLAQSAVASAQRGSVALAKNAPCTVASASSDIATNHPRDARDTAVIDVDEFEHGRASDRTLILIYAIARRRRLALAASPPEPKCIYPPNACASTQTFTPPSPPPPPPPRPSHPPSACSTPRCRGTCPGWPPRRRRRPGA